MGDRMYNLSSIRPARAANPRSEGGAWFVLKWDRNDNRICHCSIPRDCRGFRNSLRACDVREKPNPSCACRGRARPTWFFHTYLN